MPFLSPSPPFLLILGPSYIPTCMIVMHDQLYGPCKCDNVFQHCDDDKNIGCIFASILATLNDDGTTRRRPKQSNSCSCTLHFFKQEGNVRELWHEPPPPHSLVAKALNNCMDYMGGSVNELKQSIKAMRHRGGGGGLGILKK